MRREEVLSVARIHPNQVWYRVLVTNLAVAVSLVGIPFLLFTIPFSIWLYGRQYRSLRVSLTEKTLKIRRGFLIVDEKTIPLNKITDLAIYHGPLMRAYSVKGLRVETAGATGNASFGGALAAVVGIVDAEAFRDAVLEQRDHVVGADRDDAPPVASHPDQLPGDGRMLQTLGEIRDSLHRIEGRLPPAAK